MRGGVIGDSAAAAAAGLSVAVLAVLAGRFASASFELAVVASLSTMAVAALIIAAYRRLQRQITGSTTRQLDMTAQSFRQAESLLSVLATIRPSFPLPSTRDWSASPDLLNQLCTLVLSRRPALVVEAGSGVSTLTLAYCLKRLGFGRVLSLEHDEVYAAKTRALLQLHAVDDVACVVTAPLTPVTINGDNWLWYDQDGLAGCGTIDLLVIDGPPWTTQKLARYPALPLLHDRLGRDAIVILDDAARSDERAVVARWQSEFAGLTCEYLDFEKGACVIARDAVSSGAERPATPPPSEGPRKRGVSASDPSSASEQPNSTGLRPAAHGVVESAR